MEIQLMDTVILMRRVNGKKIELAGEYNFRKALLKDVEKLKPIEFKKVLIMFRKFHLGFKAINWPIYEIYKKPVENTLDPAEINKLILDFMSKIRWHYLMNDVLN